MTGEDFFKDALGQLVAPVGSATAETRWWLEKPALAPGPQGFGMHGINHHRARHASKQNLLRCAVDREIGQFLRVGQGHQVALVGVCGMDARMRRQRYAARLIHLADIAVDRRIEVKIGQPVVDQIDRLAGMQQTLAITLQFGRVGNHRINPVGDEEVAEQFKLGGEKLSAWRFIDNRNPLERRIATHQTPFVNKHGHNIGNQPRPVIFPTMRRKQIGIEQTTTGIGVDFNEFRAVDRKMEVVTHEHPQRSVGRSGNRRRISQHRGPKCRQRQHCLNSPDNLRHRLVLRLVDVDVRGRKQLRLASSKAIESGFHGVQANMVNSTGCQSAGSISPSFPVRRILSTQRIWSSRMRAGRP